MLVPAGSSQTSWNLDFVSILRSWYQDPMWENLNLFPWMDDEWALRLSEVYTQLEMETFTGKLHERETKSLGDYRELFIDIQPEGTRILVKGDPGIGKTTFTHKVAYDWAAGNLPQFDLVLVLKLKFSSKHQTIESMVIDQLKTISDNPSSIASEEDVGSYLKSGKDKILLVLGGLDEIKLKEFPHVQKVLKGEAYRKCCILATTRPHVAASFQNKATSVAKILGFSEEKAEEFTSYIITNESERKRFFEQIHKRKMSEMASIPILLQALALLFEENKQLPETLKMTYDDLVFYLRKTCEECKGLTEDEIREAMDEINELAFRGLTRDDKQLVFSRDEIQNENILKLGLLAAEKSGSGFKPTTVLYFLHGTLQEYCAADHVTTGIANRNRKPWNTLLKQFHTGARRESDAQKNIETERCTEQSDALIGQRDVGQVKLDVLEVQRDVLEARRDVDLLEAQRDVEQAKMDVLKARADVLQALIDVRQAKIDEREAQIRVHLWKEIESWKKRTDSHCRKFKPLERLLDSLSTQLEAQCTEDESQLTTIDSSLLTTVRDNALLAKKLLSHLKLSSITEKLGLHEKLFTFILSKLPLHDLETIIPEITEILLTFSFSDIHCSNLYFHNFRSEFNDFVKETRPKDESMTLDGILLNNPALIDIVAPFEDRYRHLESVARKPSCAALHISGTGKEDDSNVLNNVNHILRTMSNIHDAELWHLLLVADRDIRAHFVDALYQSPIVYLEVDGTDPLLTHALLEKLPETMRSLTICASNIVQPEPYRFPATNLRTLSLENCVIDLSQASFPNLRRLCFENVSVAPENGTVTLVHLIRRMPQLEVLEMYHITSLGTPVVNALKQQMLKLVTLNSCNLTAHDGELILESIREGQLDHIGYLSLLGNENLTGQVQSFEELCHAHYIVLRKEAFFSPPPLFSFPSFLYHSSPSEYSSSYSESEEEEEEEEQENENEGEPPKKRSKGKKGLTNHEKRHEEKENEKEEEELQENSYDGVN